LKTRRREKEARGRLLARVLSAFISAALVLVMPPLGLPLGLPLAFGAESVNVTLSFQRDASGFVMAPRETSVDAGLAERYGYSDAFGGAKASALDAVVALHLALLGDGPDITGLIQANLSVTDSGFIDNFLGDGEGNCLYLVNGALNWTAFTDTELAEGDRVSIVVPQDPYYADVLSWFEVGGAKATSATVPQGEPLSLAVRGVKFAVWGYEDAEGIGGAGIVPVELSGQSGSFGAALAVTDADGSATLAFDSPGVYRLSAIDASSDDELPLMSPWLVVTVTGRMEAPTASALQFLAAKVAVPQFGQSGGEWAVLAQARAGAKSAVGAGYFNDYYNRVCGYVQAFVQQNGSAYLHKSRSTDNSRLIIALTSMGKDATDVGGVDITAPLSDFSWVSRQGINGVAFALLALDSGDYAIEPLGQAADTGAQAGQTTRALLVQSLLDAEIGGGGWSLAGSSPDADVTAMVLQALSLYRGSAEVDAAVNRGLSKLSALQNSDGSFGSASSNGTNIESSAQALIALSALGVDAASDARFIKNGLGLLDVIWAAQLPDGGFKHLASDAQADMMASEQVALALVAYQRLLEGGSALYNISSLGIRAFPDDGIDAQDYSGVYMLQAQNAPGSALDIRWGDPGDCVPVHLWTANHTPAQRFKLQKAASADGVDYYTLTNVESGKRLDVPYAEASSGSVIWQFAANGTDAQLFSVSMNGDGSFTISPKLDPSLALDFQWGGTEDGTLLQLWERNDTAAQRFTLHRIVPAIAEGDYVLETALRQQAVLDIAGNAGADGTNAMIWTANSSQAQAFRLDFDEACGYYTLTGLGSGKLLDVYGASSANGANVHIWTANATRAQKWDIVMNGDGSFTLFSAVAGRALDVTGAASNDGANVQVWEPNGSDAQKWRLL
jgi:hypothetical protein